MALSGHLGHDVDPLGDAPAPRHAIESDEEEDEYNPLGERRATPNATTSVRVKFSSSLIKPGQALAVITGPTSVLLLLSEEDKQGEIEVNGTTVGTLYAPKYTSAVILASETTVRLPIWAMNAYVKTAIAELLPSSMNVLDTYAVPAYIIDASDASPRSAPIRYLRTPSAARQSPSIPGSARPYAPPNLLQSTTAAFLSNLNFAYPDTPGTAVLLPAQHIAHPAPKDLTPSTLPSTDYLSADYLDEQGWDAETLRTAVQMILGHEIPTDVLALRQRDALRGRRNIAAAVGEGGMYI
ncbi:hypothetical protein HDZ31DRAFT_64444 [Schizophyllum fasciatum]